MGAEIVQGKYDELTEIAGRFNEQAEQTTQMEQRLRSAYDGLQNNGWVGRGSEAFFAEMTSEMFPAVDRMHAALMAGSEVTRQLGELLKAAEEEAAGIYKNSDLGTLGGGAGGAAGGGTGGSAPGTTPPAMPTSEVFSEQNLDKLVGAQVQGAGSPALNSAMETLQNSKNPAEINAALDTIAKERGLSREAVQANYEKYLGLRQTAENNGEGYSEINQGRHPDFLGSEGSLRYGSVAGQALGLDPVFGAMLNPSGGLVGPGNFALDRGNSAVGYHGAVHDAAGYLYNAQKTGPGYDYLGREGINDTGSPITGQSSGIRYWNDKIPTSLPTRIVSEYVGDNLGGLSTVVTAGKKVVGAVSDGAGWVNDRLPWN